LQPLLEGAHEVKAAPTTLASNTIMKIFFISKIFELIKYSYQRRRTVGKIDYDDFSGMELAPEPAGAQINKINFIYAKMKLN
jgi:hypothetical protein